MKWNILVFLHPLLYFFSAFSINAQPVLLNNGVDISMGSQSEIQINGDIVGEANGDGSILVNGQLYANGNIENNSKEGLFSTHSTGTIIINGAESHKLTGATPIDIRRLEVRLSLGEAIVLENSINIAQEVFFSSGNIELAAGDINLGSTGALQNETNERRVYGTGGVIRSIQNLHNPTAFQVAGLGVAITSSQNLGETIIERGHEALSVNGEESIQRYVVIAPSNNEQLNAIVELRYYDHELNFLDASALKGYQSMDDGATWELVPSAHNESQQTVRMENLDALSKFTLAKSASSDRANHVPSSEWTVYPTVLNNYDQLSIAGRYNLPTVISLVDLNGRIIWSETQAPGAHLQHTFSIGAPSAGYYFIEVKQAGRHPFYSKILITQ